MFDHRVRELVAEQETLTTIADAMLAARALLINEVAKLHKALLRIAREDEIIGRLMSVPGVGALTAITFKPASDVPHRIKRPRTDGPLYGLTPLRSKPGTRAATDGK